MICNQYKKSGSLSITSNLCWKIYHFGLFASLFVHFARKSHQYWHKLRQRKTLPTPKHYS